MEKYPFLNEVVAKILRERRVQLNMSKRQLSLLANIERAYITGLEAGKSKISLNVFFFLCEALEIEPVEFMKKIQVELKNAHGGKKWPFLE